LVRDVSNRGIGAHGLNRAGGRVHGIDGARKPVRHEIVKDFTGNVPAMAGGADYGNRTRAEEAIERARHGRAEGKKSGGGTRFARKRATWRAGSRHPFRDATSGGAPPAPGTWAISRGAPV